MKTFIAAALLTGALGATAQGYAAPNHITEYGPSTWCSADALQPAGLETLTKLPARQDAFTPLRPRVNC